MIFHHAVLQRFSYRFAPGISPAILYSLRRARELSSEWVVSSEIRHLEISPSERELVWKGVLSRE